MLSVMDRCNMLLFICFCGPVGNTLAKEQRGHGFKPRYRQLRSGSDDFYHWVLFKVILNFRFPSGRLKNLKDIDKWLPLSLSFS